MNDISWFKKGFASRNLQYLLKEHGIQSPKAHRGRNDVICLLALLSQREPGGGTYFKELLEHRGLLAERRFASY